MPVPVTAWPPLLAMALLAFLACGCAAAAPPKRRIPAADPPLSLRVPAAVAFAPADYTVTARIPRCLCNRYLELHVLSDAGFEAHSEQPIFADGVGQHVLALTALPGGAYTVIGVLVGQDGRERGRATAAFRVLGAGERP